MTTLLNSAKHLYEHGFSFVAFIFMILAFAMTGSDQNDFRTSRALSDRSQSNLTAVQNWRQVEADWLSEKATKLTRQLLASGIPHVTVYSRLKAEESAKEKAAKRGIHYTELNDFYGMRVVVSNELEVYECLNLICHHYDIIPGTMKNYIVSPKASGYQSIHVVAQIDEHRVELQLRTEAMHLSAEAEHEAYKQRMRAA